MVITKLAKLNSSLFKIVLRGGFRLIDNVWENGHNSQGNRARELRQAPSESEQDCLSI